MAQAFQEGLEKIVSKVEDNFKEIKDKKAKEANKKRAEQDPFCFVTDTGSEEDSIGEQEIDEEFKKVKEQHRKEIDKMVSELVAATNVSMGRMREICEDFLCKYDKECQHCEEEFGLEMEMKYVCRNNHIECSDCADKGKKCSECGEVKILRKGNELEKDRMLQLLIAQVQEEYESQEKGIISNKKERLEKERLVELTNKTERTYSAFKTTKSTLVEVKGENKKIEISENKANKEESVILWNNSKVSLEEENHKLTVRIEGKEEVEINGKFNKGNEIFKKRNSLYLITNEWKCRY